jgi:hypothetical protein
MLRKLLGRHSKVVCGIAVCLTAAAGQAEEPAGELKPRAIAPSSRQAELEKSLIEMLSGATLEGSFTNTGGQSDPTELSQEKYTLGEVKKVDGDFWLIPARIQYGENDVTLPLLLPIRWAGDTPVIVVDNVGLPGFGNVSARVMFFADHYAGYWKHGKRGGHLFGVIQRAEKLGAGSGENAESASPASGGNPSRGKQENKNARQQ